MEAAFTHIFQLLRTLTESRELTKEYEAQMKLELKRIPEDLTDFILSIYQTVINIIECIDYDKLATRPIVKLPVDFYDMALSIIATQNITKAEKAMVKNLLYKLRPVFSAMNKILADPATIITKMRTIYGKDNSDLL